MPPAAEPSAPTRLRGYELLEPISSGATAIVFRGFQPSLGRPVAIKQLLPEHLGSAEALARFEREARAIAAVAHPGIVQILDYLEDDGARYIVMEHVSGHDLARVMERRGRLGIDEALAIALSVAEALWFAHARGVVHRDVKPRNILLSRTAQVKVVDFGVAQVSAPDERTTTAGFVGTPAYAAPEQVLGKRLDGRADMFALGVVLYEMLTGVKPFRNDPESNVVSKILESDPPLPRALEPRIPRRVQRVIMRCLEKSPDRRYADMAELAEALRRAIGPRDRSGARALARLTLSLFGPDSEEGASTCNVPVASSGLLASAAPRWSDLVVQRVPLLGTVASLALLGAVLVVLLGRGGRGPGGATPLDGVGGDGFCKVVAYPWAEVLVDGVLVDTTPFDRAVRLPAGTHQVALRHPDLPTWEAQVEVSPGSFQRFRVDLTGGGRFAEEDR